MLLCGMETTAPILAALRKEAWVLDPRGGGGGGGGGVKGIDLYKDFKLPSKSRLW